MKLVYVLWLDSQGSVGSWYFPHDEPVGNYERLKTHSVGWVLEDTEHFITIVPHYSGEGRDLQIRGELTIPRCAIVEIVEVKQ